MIDFQRDFVDPGGFGEALGNDVSLLRRAVPPAARVLKAAREARPLVVQTREGHRPDLADCPRRRRPAASSRLGSATPVPWAASWWVASMATTSSRSSPPSRAGGGQAREGGVLGHRPRRHPEEPGRPPAVGQEDVAEVLAVARRGALHGVYPLGEVVDADSGMAVTRRGPMSRRPANTSPDGMGGAARSGRWPRPTVVGSMTPLPQRAEVIQPTAVPMMTARSPPGRLPGRRTPAIQLTHRDG